MVHSGNVSFLQVGMLLVFMLCCIARSTGTVDSTEDRFRKLETIVYQLQEKNIRLEQKVTQLEANNAHLKIKIQQHETILMSLLVQTNELEPTGSKSIANNYQTEILSTGKMSGTPRTCQQLREDDPSLPSGMYWIDPDGQSVGDSPIYVYCDMTTGSTAILHDSESPTDVGHCAEPGCYSLSINYKASIKQIKALAELSTECHQSIKYDCFYAPFEFDSVTYSWWNDRDGNAQYFWAGNNSGGIHTCQCGILGNCVDSSVKCNCDTRTSVELADDGKITDKNVLPVTQLNFGLTQMSSGIHTLGRFECKGREVVTGLPMSCKDLWLIGHSLNGFYSIARSEMMAYVYCDFNKLPEEEGFEKWIGNAYVKSTPVHFYVQRNSSFSARSTQIPFDLARVNVGNAMNLKTGIFTAPLTGIYFFSFTGLARIPTSSIQCHLGVSLYLNGGFIGRGFVQQTNTPGQDSSVTLQSTLNLKTGDRIWVTLNPLQGAVLFDDSTHLTHFTGFLLEEEGGLSL